MNKKRNYWLMKSEPNTYSIDDLKQDKVTAWDGVRNYQARNFMRDDMKKGDLVLFYHSNAKPPGVVGVGEVSSKSYPDPTQFDENSQYFDAKATRDKPRWFLVDIKYKKKFKEVISLEYIKSLKKFSDMELTKKGSRLSVQPVKKHHFDALVKKGR
ncbi:MAG: EVE domain-containing protein [Candidatus Campbellbacteria bacterium]|nr:EVE domain-containing protein [Candidatus Campbellbacteria bacterium]